MKKRHTKFMPNDTAHCSDYKCPSKDFCLRFNVNVASDGWVTYADFGRKPDEKQCEHFIGEVIP